jgi:hypothetical protein
MEVTYTTDVENLLKKEAEMAESMNILHSKAHKKYNKLSNYINIPVIITSAFVGFLSPLSLFEKQAVFLGAISIFIGIIKTLDSYFDWTKRSETHRIIGLNYYKISKFIQIQLSLNKVVRIRASNLLDIIINDIKNLKEQEPIIPYDVIEDYKKQYAGEDTAKPPICNGLTTIVINTEE